MNIKGVITQNNFLKNYNSKDKENFSKGEILNFAINLKRHLVISGIDVKVINKIIYDIQQKINMGKLSSSHLNSYREEMDIEECNKQNLDDFFKCCIILSKHATDKPTITNWFGAINKTKSINDLVNNSKEGKILNFNNTEKSLNLILNDVIISEEYENLFSIRENEQNSLEETFTQLKDDIILKFIHRSVMVDSYPKDKNGDNITIHKLLDINPKRAYIFCIDREAKFRDSKKREYGRKMFDNNVMDCTKNDYVIAFYEGLNYLLDNELNFDSLHEANKIAVGEGSTGLTIERKALNPILTPKFKDENYQVSPLSEFFKLQDEENFDKKYLLNNKCINVMFSVKATILINNAKKYLENYNSLLKTDKEDIEKFLDEYYNNNDVSLQKYQEILKKIFSSYEIAPHDEIAEQFIKNIDKKYPKSLYIESFYESKDEILKFFDTYQQRFNNNLNKSISDYQKIAAILLFISQIECSHFFLNGNNRLCCQMLLNKLLIANKLSPSILYIPNGISHYVLSLVNKEGQKNQEIPEIDKLTESLKPAIAWVLEGQDFYQQCEKKQVLVND